MTHHIPLAWDQGRGLAGVSTLYNGHHLCVIALNHAHGHEVPFLSVNTCVHELLHVLLQDIHAGDPTRLRRAENEFRIDWHATMLWLFRDGDTIREAAQAYLERFPAGRAPTGQ